MDGSITFRPMIEDMVAVARGKFRLSLVGPRFLIRMGALLAFAAAVGTAIGFSDTGSVSVEMVAAMVGVAVGWSIVLLVGIYLFIPRRSRRLFRQQRSLAHDFTIEWDDAGLTQRWSDGALRTAWTEYHDWFETRDILAFGLNEQLYHFAPKRVLTDAQCVSLRGKAGAIAAPRARA